jgi:APA family basic amino acid/polyamine antiporter
MESHRDRGLARAVGPLALAASIVNTIVGAGIFAVPAALAACVGPYGPLVFVACAVAVGSVAICFAEGGSRVPTSGGAYGSVEAAFGPLAGFLAGVLLGLSNVLACSGVAAALGDIAVDLSPAPLRSALHALVIVGVILGIALVNLRGVGAGARLVNIVTVVKLVPLVVFVIAGAFAVHGANLAQTPAPTTGGLGRALILAIFAFSGMETPLSASGEVADPARTIPRALAMALPAVTFLYVAIQVVALGILGPSLAHSTVPLADAMARVSPMLQLLMLAGAAVSMFGWLGSDLLGSPRIVFAFARDGVLPRALARVDPRSQAPRVAILCYAALAIGLALTGTFAELAILSTLSLAPLYIAACLAAFFLARRGVAQAGTPLGFRWLRAAVVTGILSMLCVIALASRAEVAGLLAVLGASVVVNRIQTWMKLRRR